MFLTSAYKVHAQRITLTPTAEPIASDSALLATDSAHLASQSAALEQKKLEQIKKEDVTKPEEKEVKKEILELFEKRQVKKLNWYNAMAYTVQYAVEAGLPANTIVLILLLPVLCTLVVFSRHIIGLPSLGMLVSVALSITLVSTGITAGIILLVSILLGSTFARILLKRIRIIQLPKVAISILFVSMFIFLTLLFSAKAGILAVKQLSIFPVMLLILLSEHIVQLQLERSIRETVIITAVTLFLGLAGYLILSSEIVRYNVLLYPELTVLLLPANIIMGRYFGLRLTEYYRFAPLRDASK